MNLYILEEHHEAFAVWDHLGRSPTGPLADVALVHVDAHADMDLPWIDTDLAADMTTGRIQDLVYRQLDIQTFITAAVYRGFFNRVEWIRPDVEQATGGDTFIWSDRGAGRRLFMGTQAPPGSDARRFHYRWTGLGQSAKVGDGDRVMLDIDLDFFSCSDTTLPSRVGITETEFHRFHTDRRHYLRCHFGNRVQAVADKGAYWLAFTPLDGTHRSGSRQRTDAEALAVVKAFGQWLAGAAWRPEAITLCRSRTSGYTPQDQWRMLESETLAVLEEQYGTIAPMHVDDMVIDARD